MRRALALLGLFGLVAAAGAAACNGADFDPSSKIQSVRVLATRADKPFAKPGDTVNLEALAVDGRADKTRAMHVYWLPFTCTNPASDLYYACFTSFATGLGGDAGAGDGGSDAGSRPITIPPGFDLTPFLPEGPKYSITLPADIITSHPPVQGAAKPYGLAIAFFIACAGRVKLVPLETASPSGQALPIGCFDDQGNQLGADDYVFAFTRVYAYDDLTNQNPVIDPANPLTFDGNPVDPAQGVTVPACTASKPGACEHPFTVNVTDDSWELNPTDLDQNGNVRHEQIYASYFYTFGSTTSTGRVLFDPTSGRVPGSGNKFTATETSGDGQVYVVVHDNRDGAAWVSFPIYVK